MSHYFSEQPTGPERRRTVTATVWGHDLTLTTAAGVFGGDYLDKGTAVLFRECPPPTTGNRFLDLGCGYGPIALALALSRPPARVDAVDVNERALTLCTENAIIAGVADRVRALKPEQVDPHQAYDQIWSNPPIRIGKEALHALLATWLPRLAPDGEARLVVGKNLGADSLQAWLQTQGYACARLASAKSFRVLLVTRP
ncbi:MAG: class I SAM-dependent methyltransferase [Propionibacteriaceae bacterium]